MTPRSPATIIFLFMLYLSLCAVVQRGQQLIMVQMRVMDLLHQPIVDYRNFKLRAALIHDAGMAAGQISGVVKMRESRDSHLWRG